MTIKAAGILFLTPERVGLFLKRSAVGDHPGVWCIPGGKVEDGETAEKAAVREAEEECGGKVPVTRLSPLTRRVAVDQSNQNVTALAGAPAPVAPPAPPEEVDFTTFLSKVDEKFTPVLNEEHTGFAWAPIDSPPEPLHPGCRITLARLSMDELGVARAIQAGDLTSPQKYENISLFAIRITGTGTAYRRKHDEFVYRRPENYLTQEFLDRCGGLAVVMLHPVKATLDAKSYSEQAIGSIMFAYIIGDEVWGIAKIYDDGAAKMMRDNLMSTSPAVVFRDPSVNAKMELENGSTLLIEGKPSLLDHIAICENGVWDKGEGPTGINVRGDSVMTPEEIAKAKKDAEEAQAKKDADEKAEKEKADAASKKDADAGEKLDKVLSCLDSIVEKHDALSKRMDSYEEMADKKDSKKDAKKDAAEEKAKEEAAAVAADKNKKDSARKDEPAEREEMAERIKAKEKEKADADAKADSDAKDARDVKRMIADLDARIPKQLSDADYAAMADSQARADDVYSAFGKRAPRPLDGESNVAYRRRLATGLKGHSKTWKEIDLLALTDSALPIAEEQIYADAQTAALNPVDMEEGQLRPVVRRDETGRNVTTFHGRNTFIRAMARPSRRVVNIGVPRAHQQH